MTRTSSTLIGAELGYSITSLPHLILRPQLGVGNASLTFINSLGDAPDVAWVTDITYVWTAEGWLYLAAILDLFSRRVVGVAMRARIDRELVLEALRAAVGRRVPNAGLMHHSDRGSQYASSDSTTDVVATRPLGT